VDITYDAVQFLSPDPPAFPYTFILRNLYPVSFIKNFFARLTAPNYYL